MLLNCATATTALESLGAAAGATPAEVLAAARSLTKDGLVAADNPEQALPRLAAERLGVSAITGFSAVRYFHGTRTLDPDDYRRRGLLPLPDFLEELWTGVRRVGGDVLSASKFDELRTFIEGGGGGHFGWLYRHKTTKVTDFGPFGEYVREHLLRPGEVSAHGYLRTPEIVEDIATVAHERFGVDLLTPFRHAAVPCIVAFDMSVNDDVDAVRAACWYILAAADGEVTSNANGGFNGHGVAVPPCAIRDVEIVAL